jgi:hypothetical protein
MIKEETQIEILAEIAAVEILTAMEMSLKLFEAMAFLEENGYTVTR